MGLLRGMARTAVVAGTATAVSNRVSRRQYNRWNNDADASASNQSPEFHETIPQQPATDPYAELEKLGSLKQQGIITQAEFEAKKQQLLGL